MNDELLEIAKQGIERYKPALEELAKAEYRIAECLNRQTLKVYFAIQRYNQLQKEYTLFVDKHFESLEEAKKAVQLLHRYRDPIYHYADD
jgi:uncharacterized protein involved in tolerance to divalent cations